MVLTFLIVDFIHHEIINNQTFLELIKKLVINNFLVAKHNYLGRESFKKIQMNFIETINCTE